MMSSMKHHKKHFHGLTLLKEEMEHCGFTKEQIAALSLSFTKRCLMVVDASQELSDEAENWRPPKYPTHAHLTGDKG